jgi:hypothetical protein
MCHMFTPIASDTPRLGVRIRAEKRNVGAESRLKLASIDPASRQTAPGAAGSVPDGFSWDPRWTASSRMAGGQPVFASLDYGHVCGLNTAALAGTQMAGTVIGVRGNAPTRIGALAYDLFAGTPIYRPADFPTARYRWRPADRSILGE